MKISIILTTYNRADSFLPRAIRSVLNQTFRHWELIVVDDCSTDNTQEVMRKFVDKRIKYHRLEKNFGSDTRPKNEGAKLATGRYLMFMDDDVELRPDAIKTLKNELNSNPEIDVVYGDMWIKPNDEPGIARDFDAQFLMIRNFIDTSAAMMKKKAIFDIGGWDESLKKFVDWNLWVRMTKYGKKFKRVKKYTFDYYIHENTKSNKVKTESYYDPELDMTMFVPTFDPAGCYIELPYLKKPIEPTVAVFTLHYDRPEYSISTYNDMIATAEYPFDWYCWDNSGTTYDQLVPLAHFVGKGGENLGISGGSNKLLNMIGDKYTLIIKIDNDVQFETRGWLKDIVDLWKRNHKIYVSPYVEGLKDNPGGALRNGYGLIGSEFVEVTKHIGGIFACIDSRAYKDFRWKDALLHGNQDIEASHAFRLKGYMPCYYPKHRICHRDSTEGQQQAYPAYFERRKDEHPN